MLIFRRRRDCLDIEEVANDDIMPNDYETFEIIMSLPAKYKVVMVLYYVEGYKSKEIANIIEISEEAVRKRLQKGRELLKTEIEKGDLL